MDKNYMKDYIEVSNEFRKSNGSKKSVKKIYDLLYNLEKTNRTKNDDLILSSIYNLLGFHKSAYDIYKTIVDKINKKDMSKLYVMEQKSISHGNNFVIKDLRKNQIRREQTKLKLSDFVVSKKGDKNFVINNKNIVIFNKIIEDKPITITISNNITGSYFEKIINHLNWLGNCKCELIDSYNNKDFEDIANEDWFNSLEIYRVQIIINESGNIVTFISGGDDFWQDHLLDIEITNRKISSMSYDG